MRTLPKNIQFFLEVRQHEWFEGEEYEHHLKFLKSVNVGSVIDDSPERILHLGLTIPKCFIRYTPAGDLTRVKEWYDKINECGSKGLTEAYFFVQALETEKVQKKQLEALQYFKNLVVGV